MICHIIKSLLFICSTCFTGHAIAQDFQMMVIDVDVADLAYWETADRLVVCTNTDTTHGNSMLIINPYTGAIESSTVIGSIPHALDLSLDQKWAFITLFGGLRVVRFDLETLQVDQTTFTGVDSSYFNTAYIPAEITCSRESANRFAINQFRSGTGSVDGVVLFDGETNQHPIPNAIDVVSLVFTDGDQLYGSATNELIKLSTNGSEIVEEETYSFYVGDRMTYVDGFIYSSRGLKIDISGEPTITQEFLMDCSSFSRPVAIAVCDSTVFLIGDRYNAFGQHCMWVVENFPPYAQMAEVPLDERISEVHSAVAWGDGAIALQVSYRNESRNKLAIFRECTYDSDIVPELTFDGIAGGCFGDYVTLNADSTFARIFWSNGENSHEIHVNRHGEYYYQILDANGCLSPRSDTVSVSFSARPNVPDISPQEDTVEICLGEELKLYSGLSGSIIHQWSTGSFEREIVVNSGGTYSLQYSTEDGCIQPVRDTIVVIQRPFLSPAQPVTSPSVDTSLCILDSITVFGPPGFAQYNWITYSGEFLTAEPEWLLPGFNGGEIRLQVVSADGCFSPPSDPVEVQFYEPGYTSYITREGNVLTAFGTGTFRWYFNGQVIPGESGKTITVTAPGFYQVQRINLSCDSDLSELFNFE